MILATCPSLVIHTSAPASFQKTWIIEVFPNAHSMAWVVSAETFYFHESCRADDSRRLLAWLFPWPREVLLFIFAVLVARKAD
jgi:hypothetical protein